MFIFKSLNFIVVNSLILYGILQVFLKPFTYKLLIFYSITLSLIIYSVCYFIYIFFIKQHKIISLEKKIILLHLFLVKIPKIFIFLLVLPIFICIYFFHDLTEFFYVCADIWFAKYQNYFTNLLALFVELTYYLTDCLFPEKDADSIGNSWDNLVQAHLICKENILNDKIFFIFLMFFMLLLIFYSKKLILNFVLLFKQLVFLDYSLNLFVKFKKLSKELILINLKSDLSKLILTKDYIENKANLYKIKKFHYPKKPFYKLEKYKNLDKNFVTEIIKDKNLFFVYEDNEFMYDYYKEPSAFSKFNNMFDLSYDEMVPAYKYVRTERIVDFVPPYSRTEEKKTHEKLRKLYNLKFSNNKNLFFSFKILKPTLDLLVEFKKDLFCSLNNQLINRKFFCRKTASKVETNLETYLVLKLFFYKVFITDLKNNKINNNFLASKLEDLNNLLNFRPEADNTTLSLKLSEILQVIEYELLKLFFSLVSKFVILLYIFYFLLVIFIFFSGF